MQAVKNVASSGKFHLLPPDKENTDIILSYNKLIISFLFVFLCLATSIQMLAQACMQPEYYEKVIDAVRFYSRTAKEMRPFETLVKLMYQRPISPQFQVKKTCLHMVKINSLKVSRAWKKSYMYSIVWDK